MDFCVSPTHCSVTSSVQHCCCCHNWKTSQRHQEFLLAVQHATLFSGNPPVPSASGWRETIHDISCSGRQPATRANSDLWSNIRLWVDVLTRISCRDISAVSRIKNRRDMEMQDSSESSQKRKLNALKTNISVDGNAPANWSRLALVAAPETSISCDRKGQNFAKTLQIFKLRSKDWLSVSLLGLVGLGVACNKSLCVGQCRVSVMSVGHLSDCAAAPLWIPTVASCVGPHWSWYKKGLL